MFPSWLCCCSTTEELEQDDPTVIPNERSRLIDTPPSPTAVIVAVDHQKLNDRYGTIVRAKEGRMVSVSSRAPFDLHDADDDDDAVRMSASEPPTPTRPQGPGLGRPSAPSPPPVLTNRRPPVLTMTPARSHGSFGSGSASGYIQDRSNSRGSSRSSSRVRPARTTSASSSSGAGMGGSSVAGSSSARARVHSPPPPTTSEWFVESASETGSIAETDEEGFGAEEAAPHAPKSTPVPPRAPIVALAEAAEGAQKTSTMEEEGTPRPADVAITPRASSPPNGYATPYGLALNEDDMTPPAKPAPKRDFSDIAFDWDD